MAVTVGAKMLKQNTLLLLLACIVHSKEIRDNNQLQTVNYVADALGFRVADSRLPVAPTYDGVAPVAPVYDGVAPVAPVYDGVAPEPVKDTPEVIAARAEHLAAFEKVAAEHRYQ